MWDALFTYCLQFPVICVNKDKDVRRICDTFCCHSFLLETVSLLNIYSYVCFKFQIHKVELPVCVKSLSWKSADTYNKEISVCTLISKPPNVFKKIMF